MAGEWRPIESAPKDGVLVLVWEADLEYMEFMYFKEGVWRDRDGSTYETIPPTHWQPLPAPPEQPLHRETEP